MTTKYIVNNVSGQTINGQQLQPYKVYTALLTQSGGNDPLNLLSQDSPSLTIGVTYEITDDGGSGWDFTNVGAPNNDLGTYFVATGTTPADWGTNGMLQYNTGAPVVTVLENTIGNVWFTYMGTGECSINSDGLFTSNKTVFFGSASGLGDDVIILAALDNIPNLVEVRVVDSTIAPADNYGSSIEIRVYN